MDEPILKSRREEYSDATRAALIDSARSAFAEQGYAGASAEAISRTARVTRGAFYHHFADKKALFDAVVVTMQAEAVKLIARRAGKEKGLWNMLETGIDAYLDACVVPDYARIVVSEGPSVLGAERFAKIDADFPMALLRHNLEALKSQGEIEHSDIALLAQMVDAMICKIAVALPATTNPKRMRAEGKKLILTMLSGLRTS